MSQHFLLSSKAKTLSVGEVLRMSDAEAYETLKATLSAETTANPFAGNAPARRSTPTPRGAS